MCAERSAAWKATYGCSASFDGPARQQHIRRVIVVLVAGFSTSNTGLSAWWFGPSVVVGAVPVSGHAFSLASPLASLGQPEHQPTLLHALVCSNVQCLAQHVG